MFEREAMNILSAAGLNPSSVVESRPEIGDLLLPFGVKFEVGLASKRLFLLAYLEAEAADSFSSSSSFMLSRLSAYAIRSSSAIS